MQLAVASTELELFEEQRVIVEGERVEDVEVGLLSVSQCVEFSHSVV